MKTVPTVESVESSNLDETIENESLIQLDEGYQFTDSQPGAKNGSFQSLVDKIQKLQTQMDAQIDKNEKLDTEIKNQNIEIKNLKEINKLQDTEIKNLRADNVEIKSQLQPALQPISNLLNTNHPTVQTIETDEITAVLDGSDTQESETLFLLI